MLPRPFRWMTASIGLHHLHHLSPKIPNYRLQECLDSSKELEAGTQVTFPESRRLTKLHLWDDEEERLIGFGELQGRATGT